MTALYCGVGLADPLVASVSLDRSCKIYSLAQGAADVRLHGPCSVPLCIREMLRKTACSVHLITAIFALHPCMACCCCSSHLSLQSGLVVC